MANTVGIRRFTRINFEQDVRLDFGENHYEQSTCNLSLGGLCVRGHFAQELGDCCKIEMRQTGTLNNGLSMGSMSGRIITWEIPMKKM